MGIENNVIERLNELFDTVVDIKRLSFGKIKRGLLLRYVFKINDREYLVTFEIIYQNKLYDNRSTMELEFDLEGEFGLTGTGDAKVVFAAVKDCIKLVITDLGGQPDYLIFAADLKEPSRVKMYDRLKTYMPRLYRSYSFQKTFELKGHKIYVFISDLFEDWIPHDDIFENFKEVIG